MPGGDRLDYLRSENSYDNYQKRMHKRNVPNWISYRICPTLADYMKNENPSQSNSYDRRSR